MERCVIACGLYRSGTTYLQTVFDTNLVNAAAHPKYPDQGWNYYKHAALERQMPRFPHGAVLVVTYKPLLKWIDSLVRNSFNLIDDDYDLVYEKGHTPIEIAYREEDQPDDEPLPVGVSLEKLIALYHLHWDFWHDKAGYSTQIVSHKKVAADTEQFLSSFCHQWNFSSRRNFIPVTVVKNSKPYTATDDNYVEFLTAKQIDVIHRWTRPEIQEALL